jgi:hypothetical protein
MRWYVIKGDEVLCRTNHEFFSNKKHLRIVYGNRTLAAVAAKRHGGKAVNGSELKILERKR